MFKIICPNCNKENTFQTRSKVPSECSFCFELFDTSVPITESIEQVGEIKGLTIIYQIDQQRIEISTLNKTILGRENFGSNIFSKILYNGRPVVSRIHCSIEFKDGVFYLLDEGSKNGTFYGVNKINCKNSPQIIENNSIFYIGEEPFIAQINYTDFNQFQTNDLDQPSINVTKIVKGYRCSACGNEFSEKTDECPNCERHKTLIDIYE